MAVGFADSSHSYNEEIQLEREDKGSRNSEHPFFLFANSLGLFKPSTSALLEIN